MRIIKSGRGSNPTPGLVDPLVVACRSMTAGGGNASFDSSYLVRSPGKYYPLIRKTLCMGKCVKTCGIVWGNAWFEKGLKGTVV